MTVTPEHSKETPRSLLNEQFRTLLINRIILQDMQNKKVAFIAGNKDHRRVMLETKTVY